MTLDEIKAAVREGKRVCWASNIYEVLEDNIGQWLIRCTVNDSYIGLTHRDGVTMNGKPAEFFIDETVRCGDCQHETRKRDLTLTEDVNRCPDCHEDFLRAEDPEFADLEMIQE